jgi:hypothetical protein
LNDIALLKVLCLCGLRSMKYGRRPPTTAYVIYLLMFDFILTAIIRKEVDSEEERYWCVTVNMSVILSVFHKNICRRQLEGDGGYEPSGGNTINQTLDKGKNRSLSVSDPQFDEHYVSDAEDASDEDTNRKILDVKK